MGMTIEEINKLGLAGYVLTISAETDTMSKPQCVVFRANNYEEYREIMKALKKPAISRDEYYA